MTARERRSPSRFRPGLRPLRGDSNSVKGRSLLRPQLRTASLLHRGRGTPERPTIEPSGISGEHLIVKLSSGGGLRGKVLEIENVLLRFADDPRTVVVALHVLM